MKNPDVVLIVPPSESFRQAEEHLGIGYLSAVLKVSGISSIIIDGFLGQMSCADIAENLKVLKPRIIGFSPYQDSLGSFSKLAKFVRDKLPNVHISLGGFLSSFNYSWLFSSFPNLFDSIVVGEGEVSFSELVKSILSGKDWRMVRGIVFREGSEIIKNPAQSKILNLDSLPFPDRSTIKETLSQKNPLHICASRGCYGNCTFCSVNAFGRLSIGEKWRGRSVRNIIDEVELLQKEYGAVYFKFIDDCWFPLQEKKERAIEFCQELDKRNLRIKFRLSCRVNDVEYDIFKELKERGLFSVSLGVESIISRQLKEWKKGVTPEQNILTLEICRKLGIIVQMGYIMLDRNTTLEELKQHLSFLKKSRFTITKGIYSFVFAAEGTDLTEDYKKNGKTEKRGINLDYDFKSKEVSEIASALKKWSKFYGDTYSWAIDSLSAPKAISAAERQEIHQMVMALKKKELGILRVLIKLAEERHTALMDSYIKREIAGSRAFFAAIEDRLTNFYKKAGLFYRKGSNIYL